MSGMKYAEIPYVDKKVSRIIYGTAAPPFLEGGDGNELLDAVFSAGVNAFDTARNYALAEKSLGQWMEDRQNRDEVVILSKCGHPDADGTKRINETDIRKDLAESCGYLKTDYIDIYLLHRDDPDMEVGPIVEIMNALHALVPFSVSSPNFGLADQVEDPWGGGCITISGPANEEARAWYRRTQIPVIAYSSLGRGLFSGKVRGDRPELARKKNCTVPQIAMAWLYCQNINSFAVVNTGKAGRMQENIDALHIDLTEDESLYLDLK